MICQKCGATSPDAAKFCQNCGQTLGAAPGPQPAPAAGAPPQGYPPQGYPAQYPPGYVPAPIVQPVCPMCRSPYLQYFQNGKGTCATCRYIFAWGYTPYGQIVLYPNTLF